MAGQWTSDFPFEQAPSTNSPILYSRRRKTGLVYFKELIGGITII